MTVRGGSREVNGHFYARARFGRSKRLELRVPWATNRDEAKARAQIIAEVADALVTAGRRDLVRSTAEQLAAAATDARLAAVRKAAEKIASGALRAGVSHDITFADWADRYVSGRLAEAHPDHVKKRDHSDDVSRLRKYILPHLEEVPISVFALEHAELVMSKLPPMSQANRRHIAQLIGRLMHLAVFPGKIIKATPIPRGWLPKITKRRHYSCLYPKEEAKFLRCDDISEAFRLFCGVLNREGMRLSELLDCDWWHWGEDCRTFTTTKNKTGDSRMWAVRPDVAAAMRAWKERRGDDSKPFAYIIALGDRTKLAERFRNALRAAGVTRPELFASTEHTGQLRAHDMRATFVTIALAEGKTDTWVRDRTGHRSTHMVDRYRRLARQVAELELGGLVDLVLALGWGKDGGSGVDDGGGDEDSTGEKCTERDSNPHGVTRRNLNALPVSEEPPPPRKTRGKDTSRDVSKSSSPGLPPPFTSLLDPRSAECLNDSTPVGAAAVGLAAELAVWDALDHTVAALERAEPVPGLAKASARAAVPKKRRARGGRP